MYLKKFLVVAILSIFTISLMAQCTTLDQISNSNEIEEACILYRDHLKNDNIEEAFAYWTKVYENAPALNGRLNYVYSDGRILLIKKFDATRNKKEKRKYADFVLKLYKEELLCFPEKDSKAIPDKILNFKY